MCGHSFHNSCIDGANSDKRVCFICYDREGRVFDMIEQDKQKCEKDRFLSEVKNGADKFHIVTQNFGKHLFQDLNQPEAEEGEMNKMN